MRVLCSRIQGLKYGSRIHQDWSVQEHMLADQTESLTFLLWQMQYLLAANNISRIDMGVAPDPIHRPKDPPEEDYEDEVIVEFASEDKLKAIFGS